MGLDSRRGPAEFMLVERIARSTQLAINRIPLVAGWPDARIGMLSGGTPAAGEHSLALRTDDHIDLDWIACAPPDTTLLPGAALLQPTRTTS
jgi:hypothetical protein